MRSPLALPPRRTVAALACAALVGAAVTALATSFADPAAGKAAAIETVAMPASGSMTVHWRGNGHGHGMSQYGARGAADRGLSTAKILAFYYPRTTLSTVTSKAIRVRLSDMNVATTIFAAKGLTLGGYGHLPSSGYRYFRLAPSGAGLKLQAQKTTTWTTLKGGLPKVASFDGGNGGIRVHRADGTSTRYHGRIGAARSGSGELTYNRVSLDRYAQGVAPREMPAGWSIAAVAAQAVAARTYAKSSMDAVGGGGLYDICDTTMCQVYGGMARYDHAGHVLYTDDPAAIVGNAGKVLTYQGAAIFAQYSASNGGATVNGGKPYLLGKNDPYDTTAAGDPYLNESNKFSVSSLARAYGLRTVSSIQVTKRDGHGPWGGRITTAYVNGTAKSGAKAHLATTGVQLGDRLGAYSDYLRVTR